MINDIQLLKMFPEGINGNKLINNDIDIKYKLK